jgi:hypothetical protein
MRRPLLRLEVRAFVGRHAEPGQRGDNPVGPLSPVALLVRVLDAQDKGAVVLANKEPIEEGSAGAADVEVPSRRRSEARPG